MRVLLKLLCVLSFLAAPACAWASAWTQPTDKGLLIIASGAYYSADRYFDNRGDKRHEPTYSKYELNPYMEYGINDGLTAGANLSLQRTHQNAFPTLGAQTNWGIGDSEFFLRKRLWQSGGFALAAEPMIKLPSPDSRNDLPQIGGSHPDLGLGLSGGYGFDAWGQHHFADIDTQYRHRFGAPHDQWRITASAGVGLTQRLTLMPQLFLTYRANNPAVASFTQSSADDYDLTKLQLSALYQASDDLTLQLGGFGHLDGKNVGAGGGVLLAAWKRF